MYVFWLAHAITLLPSFGTAISKFHSTRASIKRISAYARFLPMQERGPTLKGCEEIALFDANSTGAEDSQRSGMKEVGRAKFSAEFERVH